MIELYIIYTDLAQCSAHGMTRLYRPPLALVGLNLPPFQGGPVGRRMPSGTLKESVKPRSDLCTTYLSSTELSLVSSSVRVYHVNLYSNCVRRYFGFSLQ